MIESETILLVDDHRTFLAGTRLILEQVGWRVTTAASGAEAIGLLEGGARFELYMYDLRLPGMNGYELTERTLALHPEAVIVILTGEDLADHYDRLMHAGATTLLEKSMGEQELAQALRLARLGLTVLPLPLARQLRMARPGEGPDGPCAAVGGGLGASASGSADGVGAAAPPSEKERAVLQAIAQGLKNKDIADRLFMSQRNVEYILSRLFERLSVQSRQEAVLKALERGWLKVDGGE